MSETNRTNPTKPDEVEASADAAANAARQLNAAARAPEPSLSIADLKAYAADPKSSAKKARAHQLLKRCGPLVVDGVHYAAGEKGEIVARPAADARRQAVDEQAAQAKAKGKAKPAFDEDLD